jgi:peptide/nickel transport system permease protein
MDAQGRFHFHPFVYRRVEQSGQFRVYEEITETRYPIRLFLHGASYRLSSILGGDRHLFGVDTPAHISLMGTDAYGRDVFSRLLYGGQISLFAGLLATALSLLSGTSLGILAGF